MSKRDTIIVTVLINVGILAILFMFAMNTSGDRIEGQSNINYTLEDTPPPMPTQVASSSNYDSPNGSMTSSQQNTPRDEVDDALNSYTNNTNSSSSNMGTTMEIPLTTMEQPEVIAPVEKPISATPERNGTLTEVIVKKGDALEKIARAHGTSVDEIKRINSLANERLSIGQVLKVPSNKISTIKIANVTTAPTPKAAVASNKSTVKIASSDVVYYTIKSGDNPWKIARQYKVKYEDILRLNNLNEDKARNLKVGDKIRVK